jgi:hypothetical protein
MSPGSSTPPDIGGTEWDGELPAIGVDRATVDATLGSSGTGVIDPHALSFAGEPAAVAAAWVLLHQDHPSYAALMYLRHVWLSAGPALRAWIVRQFAAMLLHGPAPVAASAGYGLWVDYFETPRDAPEVFTGLAAQLPHTHWPRLLGAAGPVPWAVKRERFLEAADDPALHDDLAAGIAGSFFDVYGDVDAVDAARLLRRLTITDDNLRAALVEATTEPLRLRSGSVIVVEDPAWQHPGSILLSATVSGGRWRFAPGSDLVADGTVYGRMMHWAFPFDGTPAHRVIPGRPLDGHPHLHRIETTPQHAEALVDRDLELWLPGLRAHVARAGGDG